MTPSGGARGGEYRTPTGRRSVPRLERAARTTPPAGPATRLPGLFHRRFGSRLRLRHKLGLILSLAALLPVAGASTVAVKSVLQFFEYGVRDQTDRTRSIALNLLLDQVRDVFDSGRRIAERSDLIEAIEQRAGTISELLARNEKKLPRGLIEVADAHGAVVGSHTVGDPAQLEQYRLVDDADLIRRALGYERRVTLQRTSTGRLVVRAAAPIVDDAYQLRGAVVVTVPIDSDFADRLKAQLSADVVFYAGAEPIASSFVGSDGRRQPGFAAPDEIRDAVTHVRTAFAELPAYGRSYAVGYVPLVDIDSNIIGMLAVATDEENLVRAKAQAWRSLLLGGFSAVLFALVLAALLSRRLTRPLGHLHAGALAVAAGDLGTRFPRETGDEIGDLADAFARMTRAVRANQESIAARMREITTLHKIGRAITSVLGLDEVLRRSVGEVAEVLAARRCVLLLARPDGTLYVGAGVGIEGKAEISVLGEELAWRGGPILIDDISHEADLSQAAANANVWGTLLAVPLEQKDRVLGLLLVNRSPSAAPFTDSDLRLVATLADHMATAIQNARLYDEVQRSTEELERKVLERTTELVQANEELERTLHELGRTQSQLVLSERLAGLGALVAGIAHEINSPAGAIQGAVDTVGENVSRLARRARELGDLAMTPADRTRFFALVEELAPRLASARVEAPAAVRRRARELAAELEERGITGALEQCRTLVEVGAAEAALELAPLGLAYGFEPLVGYLEQYAYLHRNTYAIRTAIRRITRIVGALKSYSHLDQARVSVADVHEGIENTLIIIHHELKYGISITKKYAHVPSIPIYVDELNQVWTNLIHNAVQALEGRGEIVIESRVEGPDVAIVIADSGPGIPPDIIDRIFDPFFTTKAKGEGTGLGLGIVKQIVEKHGGHIEVASRPGDTRFTVLLPIAGPPLAGVMETAEADAIGAEPVAAEVVVETAGVTREAAAGAAIPEFEVSDGMPDEAAAAGAPVTEAASPPLSNAGETA